MDLNVLIDNSHSWSSLGHWRAAGEGATAGASKASLFGVVIWEQRRVWRGGPRGGRV